MKYYVYIDRPTRISTVHVEAEGGGCGAYERRKEDPLPDNWWHGPYSEELAARSAGKAGKICKIEMCKKCKFPRIMRTG